ncbi:MAG: hypothetical protein M3R38_38055 [Actinomycetota bacterium]|nr:hypothetical protein [Actinomycetota bacterium]
MNHRMSNTAKVFSGIVGEVAQNNANVSFRPDGRYGYVAVTGEDTLALVRTESLEAEKRPDTGEKPMGLIVLKWRGRTG